MVIVVDERPFLAYHLRASVGLRVYMDVCERGGWAVCMCVSISVSLYV